MIENTERWRMRALAIVTAAVVGLSVAAPASAQAREPWIYDPHPPIVEFVHCASSPDYPFAPTCPMPAIQHETRHRQRTFFIEVLQRRRKLWGYLGSDGGAVDVDPANEGFYASEWSDWRTHLVP